MGTKRILIVTEGFSLGGLETHLAGMVRVVVAAGHPCYLAVGGEPPATDLPAGLSGVLTGLPFNWPATARDLLAGVERMVAFIREHKINLVHAHPYLSLLPAALAAQRAEVPVVVTLHGPANVNPPGKGYGYLHQLLLRFFTLPTASLVYCVSPEVHTLVQTAVTGPKIRILPNGVDLNAYTPPTTQGKQWAVVGRLDAYKVQGIKDFCRKAVQCGIKRIDVYGDGPAREELNQFIVDMHAAEIITLRGATRSLAAELRRGYGGVAGMGRVVLEAAAMNLPIVLAGYDGAKGLLDEATAAQAAWWNFSGRGMVNISDQDLNTQINQLLVEAPERYRLRNWADKHHNEDDLWTQYAHDISECAFRSNPLSAKTESIFKAHAGSSGPYLVERGLVLEMTRAFVEGMPETASELALSLLLDVDGVRDVLDQTMSRISAVEQQAGENRANLQNLTALQAQHAALETKLIHLAETERERAAQLADRVAELEQVANEQTQQLSQNEKEAAEQDERLAAAARDLSAARNEADSARQQLAQHTQSWQVAQGELAAVRTRAMHIANLLESWKMNKSFRVARIMQLAQRELLGGPFRERFRFVARAAKRAGGKSEPLSSYNAFAEPIAEASAAVAGIDRVLQGRSQACAAPAVSSPLSGPASSGLRPTCRRARPSVVNIVTSLYFDFEGRELMCGGAERYLIELGRIIRQLGYCPEIYQCGHGDWVRWYDGTRVTGLDIGNDINLLNARFHEQVPPGALTIYSAFILAQPLCHPHSLGISHGLFWDNSYYQSSPAFFEAALGSLRGAIANCTHTVSVDTNTINWVRGTMHEYAHKLSYVPNFVDVEVFAPRRRNTDGRIVVLYPRRLYEPRGFWLVAELVPELIKKYPQVDFHFVGKADPPEAEAARGLEKKFPGRVRWYSLEPDRMHEAYDAADIALVPTKASEGTSLSCLEAMASGNAVIATNVGGLPELITDGYSGLLISPTGSDLREAIERLVVDEELRQRLKTNARQVALSYGAKVWRERWRRVLEKALPPRPTAPRTQNFVHPWAGGVVWGRMMQRPQQLFQALAEQGANAYFVVDEQERKHEKLVEGRLHILGRRNKLAVDHPIIHIYLATNYPQLADFEAATIIYDILDDPKIYEAADRGNPPDANHAYYHKRLLIEADLVITSSKRLYDRFRAQRADIVLVPNGVRPEDFQGVFGPRPKDMPAKGPVIGYYGAVAEWFDFEMLEHAADKRPDYQFVLIGLTNRLADIEKVVARHKNIRYLGEKRYEELPAYLAAFDVGTIPFLLNEITHAVSPVKLFEYAAGGKPIVASTMEEVLQYSAVLTANDAPEFVRKLDEALKLGQDPEFIAKLRGFAAANSWLERARRIAVEVRTRMGRVPAASC